MRKGVEELIVITGRSKGRNISKRFLTKKRKRLRRRSNKRKETI